MAIPENYGGWHRGKGDETHNPTGVLEAILPSIDGGTSARQLHVAGAEDADTDWGVAAQTHPTVYLHSATTPITDYMRLGGHDGTTSYVDVVGGTTLAMQVAGTNAATLTAGALTLTSGACASQLRIAEPSGSGTSYTGFTSPALAGNVVYTLPTADGSACQQLTTNGSAVLSWAAASRGAYKNDLGIYPGEDALETIKAAPIHRFTYCPDKVPAGQRAPTGEFVGVFAEESPWAMQGASLGAFSPVNSFGMLTAAVQQLATKVELLEERLGV